MLDQCGYPNVISDPYQFYPQQAFDFSPMAGSYAPANPNPKKHIFNAPPKRSNALFIKNLPYNLSSDEFLKIFKQFGEIASISLHIQNRGIAFVTYYDLRAAEAAKIGLQGFNVYGRFPAIDYSYKPPNYSKIDPREFSSLVKVNANTNSSLSKEDVQKSFSKYGEISEINEFKENINNSDFKSDHLSFLVLFYDSRCAHNACAEGFIEIKDIKCQCEVFVEKDNSVIYSVKPNSKYQSNQNSKNFDRFKYGQIMLQNTYPSVAPHYQPIVSATASGISPPYQPPSPPVSNINVQYPYQYNNNNISPSYMLQQQPIPQKGSPIAQQQSMVYQPPMSNIVSSSPLQHPNPIPPVQQQQQIQGQETDKLKNTLMKLKTLLHK